MTEERLEQYRALKLEIAHLENRINHVLIEGPQYTGDTVSTAAEFPYSKHLITIRGCEDLNTYKRRLSRLHTRLIKSKAEFEELDEYITAVPDARIRAIMQFKYVEGWSWLRIAQRFGWIDESAPRQKIKKYFTQTEKTEKTGL